MRSASLAPANSLISAPAAKIRSPPVITTAPGGFAVKSRAISHKRARTAWLRALTLGLFKVTMATPSERRSSNTRSSIASTVPPPPWVRRRQPSTSRRQHSTDPCCAQSHRLEAHPSVRLYRLRGHVALNDAPQSRATLHANGTDGVVLIRR